ncbi:LysR family transcriptional regulator [uncultured Acidaminococcus sp.]|jgi:DNA-binding transcriptional LysR family regulator|uniref:LysR family transcriptional regulator n=1 Tax=uncultured Acidaminococcus sp. TaxID=352152 RepID=UPI00265DCF05|nr:LysR family transcriptional regulator [uncultured Acidaminococcus sp.]
MDFRELQYVVTVADCRSITQAAKQLFISQPSLSYALGQIEKEMGVKLFDRSRQPLTLTDAGRIYVKTARTILQERLDLQNRLSDLKDGQGAQIRLGIPPERAGHMLPPIINQFRQKFPSSEFIIREAGTEELLELLRNNRVDFLICPRDARTVPSQMETELIYHESIQLIAAANAFSPDLFLDRKKRLVNFRKLARLPFIGIKKRHSIRSKVDAIFQERSCDPHLLLEVESSSTAAQLAACGLGWTLVPRRARKILGAEADACSYNFSLTPVQWEINAIYKKDAYLNKAERYFLDLMKEAFHQREEKGLE